MKTLLWSLLCGVSIFTMSLMGFLISAGVDSFLRFLDGYDFIYLFFSGSFFGLFVIGFTGIVFVWVTIIDKKLIGGGG